MERIFLDNECKKRLFVGIMCKLEVFNMQTTTYSNFKKNLKSFMAKVTDDCETIIITRKGNKNSVLISEDQYNNMIENKYVLGNPTNLKWLESGKNKLKYSENKQ